MGQPGPQSKIRTFSGVEITVSNYLREAKQCWGRATCVSAPGGSCVRHVYTPILGVQSDQAHRVTSLPSSRTATLVGMEREASQAEKIEQLCQVREMSRFHHAIWGERA